MKRTLQKRSWTFENPYFSIFRWSHVHRFSSQIFAKRDRGDVYLERIISSFGLDFCETRRHRGDAHLERKISSLVFYFRDKTIWTWNFLVSPSAHAFHLYNRWLKILSSKHKLLTLEGETDLRQEVRHD